MTQPVEEVYSLVLDADQLEQCTSMQQDEFGVLESIYPEFVSSRNLDGDALKLEIPVQFGTTKSVLISEPPPPSNTGIASLPEKKQTLQSISLTTLPPILINITLPRSYPLQKPPVITSIRATHIWLSEVEVLQSTLIELWQTAEPVLFNWIEYIRTGDFLEKLNLVSPGNSDIIALPHPAPRLIAPLLLEYDSSAQSSQFAQNSYPCSVCLTSLKGSKCLQLKCKHIFCRTCLEDFWKMCIAEGDISRVGCPDPECVKKANEAGEEEVARVVTEAELQRWKWLREKRNVERDPTVVHCPVAVCQAPVPKPIDADKETPGWSRLRTCPRCGYSFCAFCRRTWHGPLDKCPIAQYEHLALEYLGAEEGSPERAKLERRFGKANIIRLVATYEEEKANMQWLSSSTMQCPGCQCHVEKNMGCNHMTCWKCSQHFCYRCGERLNPDQPYAHFSNPKHGCFNQLFDVIDVPEAEWELEE
ncbi:E3 ubiquitin-protein ligase itt1 [Psilocybe cubensis]|uniref:E3 ubiquitin-protein ligase itt1 n=2 Tax=Psilocybe cubensis TaxID=181762 RepID=A0ACB8HHH4_PSICU|nr:E3 ubiquitin-protein ligase itt1 [Psilocybe cubensis]KAH9487157.1 E3 ubiquitin-protein ligase itt1 [Psilocybe cubensis]